VFVAKFVQAHLNSLVFVIELYYVFCDAGSVYKCFFWQSLSCWSAAQAGKSKRNNALCRDIITASSEPVSSIE
jgi:hypothetical protein